MYKVGEMFDILRQILSFREKCRQVIETDLTIGLQLHYVEEEPHTENKDQS